MIYNFIKGRDILSNTLFISDLDGTLLTPDCIISKNTAGILNSLIEKGMRFSIATARTSATVEKLLSDVNMNIPVILMNGAAMFDLRTSRYVCAEIFTQKTKELFAEVLVKNQNPGFLYTISDGVLDTWYVKVTNEYSEKFMEERKVSFGKVFNQVESFKDCINFGAVHYSLSDSYEKLEPIYDDLKKIEGLHAEFYRDIYNEGIWYLEACSAFASKFNAAKKLKEMVGAERTVAFGDNLNDLPLFEAADVKVAVANAGKEVKAKADIVIDSNSKDAVARFLFENQDI